MIPGFMHKTCKSQTMHTNLLMSAFNVDKIVIDFVSGAGKSQTWKHCQVTCYWRGTRRAWKGEKLL